MLTAGRDGPPAGRGEDLHDPDAGSISTADIAPALKILILTTDIGAGHDVPAYALAAEFAAQHPKTRVTILDGVDAMNRIARYILKDGSRVIFRWMPWLYELQYLLAMRLAPTRWLAQRLLCLLASRQLLKLVHVHSPDMVISTFPGVTAVLGELRLSGRLEVPAFSAITDLAGLYFWAHPGIDLHFVTHPESIEEVERIAGPGSVRWARPPTSPGFLKEQSSDNARQALNLPRQGKVVVISGGGWGVGDLDGAVSTVLEIEATVAVCICGHNDKLRQRLEHRFGSNTRVKLIGFTDQMSDLLAAADALIHSTAGLTVLEALMRGCPVISYGFPVGHIRLNNEALTRFGLAEAARSRKELAVALEHALAQHKAPDLTFAALPSSVELMLEGRH